MASLSASGARIRGDDYQHVFAWYQALRALQPDSDISTVGIEDPDAGRVDDVTVYRAEHRDEFYQVKSSVDARAPVNVGWLIESSRAGGDSVIAKFHRAWVNLARSGSRPKLALVTNRQIDPGDPVMILRDGRDGTIAARLAEVRPTSKAGRARRALAEHLGIDEEAVLDFLRDLRFYTGKLHEEWEEQVSALMYSLGLRGDRAGVQAGISAVRGWVTGARRKLSSEEIRREVSALNLQAGEPAGTFLIQAIDYDPLPEGATVALDWVELYEGDEPRVRRRLRDPDLWKGRLRDDIQEAVRQLRAREYRRVLVRGYMRLPTWFAVGTELGNTTGFEVLSRQRSEIWGSDGEITHVAVETAVDEKLGRGGELAIGISLSTDLISDVIGYLDRDMPQVGHYICLAPEDGPSSRAIRDAREARGWVHSVRDLVRDIVRSHRPDTLHMFLAIPHSAALLLGHLWDRMPATQLYHDQGPLAGYEPSFLIPN